MMRFVLIISLFLVVPAIAAKQSTPVRIDCEAVRGLVSQYGLEAVEQEARNRQVSERTIQRAKRCLGRSF